MTNCKYFSYDTLKATNKKSIGLNLNRTLNEKFLERLDKTKLYPVSACFVHNDDHMRIRFVHNEHGLESSGAWLDMTFEDYDFLPTFNSEEVA